MFVAAIVGGVIILLLSISCHRTEALYRLTPVRTAALAALLISAWVTQFCDFLVAHPNDHRGDIAAFHVLLIVTVWGLLAATYFRLHLFRVLTLHGGGVIFFALFIGLASPMAARLPEEHELMWFGYVACFTGSLVSAPYAIVSVAIVAANTMLSRQKKAKLDANPSETKLPNASDAGPKL